MNLTLIRKEIVRYARQFVGTPYIWGGNVATLTDGTPATFWQKALVPV